MKQTGRPLIITAATEHLPWWVRARDAGLTLLLWIGCGWMWLQLFPEVRNWYVARSRDDLEYQVPAIVELLQRGLLYTGVLLATYALWSYQTWREANRDTTLPAPPELPPDEEARRHGLPADQLPGLRAAASVTIHLGRDGRVEAWRAGPGK
jgi:poly-beta-1,6-N-acetyl-D-glucosamine biosynthesis protein PgaD